MKAMPLCKEGLSNGCEACGMWIKMEIMSSQNLNL